jgi:uncharacterized protein with HEPN domain
MRSDRERLDDILAAADKILSKVAEGRELLATDPMVQVWVLYHLQIIGEAARTLSLEFRRKHPDKTWGKAAGLRNILVHHYFDIDHDEVWRIVEHDLPGLRNRVGELLNSGTV